MEDLTIDKNTGFYQRICGTNREKLERLYTSLYSGSGSFIFPSGMNAIYIVTRSILQMMSRNDTFLYGNELYCDTMNKIIEELKIEFNHVKFVSFDVKKPEEFKNAVRMNKVRCLFLETATNPSGNMFNWSQLEFLHESCYVVVDNTWLTSYIFNPFSTGRINAVVESSSKYLSKGKCIGGCAVFRSYDDPIIKKVSHSIKFMGLHVSPIHCDMVIRGIKELEPTMDFISNKTKLIVSKLKENTKVDKILHCGDSNHPTYSIHKKYCKDIGNGVIWFSVKLENKGMKIKKWKKTLSGLIHKHGIPYATSFGKSYSLIDMWPVMKTDRIWLRLSVGYYEEPGLIKQLQNLIEDI